MVFSKFKPIIRLFLAIAGLMMVIAATLGLVSGTSGVEVTRAKVDGTPVRVYQAEGDDEAARPVVVIAHGFAGSQQMMKTYAAALARRGYLAVTFDFPGHGRNAEPLQGGLSDNDAAAASLLGSLDKVIAYARALPASDGRLALLGHSMAADIAIRAANASPDVAATVAISGFYTDATATSPANLLVMTGEFEPDWLHERAREAVALATDEEVVDGKTYGDLDDGTGRRMVMVDNTEHIGVLYSIEAVLQSILWFDGTFDMPRGRTAITSPTPWLILIFLALMLLGRPLLGYVPRPVEESVGADLGWGRLLLIAVIPAIATPLLLWPVPTDILPLLLGDYLAVHFLVYGVLTLAGLWLVGRLPMFFIKGARNDRLVITCLGAAVLGTVVLTIVVDGFLTSFVPTLERAPMILVVLVGTLCWAVADEWLTRGPNAPKGAYTVTKLCFLGSLALAVALSPSEKIFLLIFAPVILIFFVFFGVMSGNAYRSIGHPLVGAATTALAFAWAISVTFPIVG